MRRPLANVAVTLALACALATTGCFMPDDRPRVSIEFGMYPELFEGCDVVIDGQVVGKLETTGRATRISFPVEPGRHEVSIKHPKFACQPVQVRAELAGQKVRLMADLQERASRDGSIQPVISLQ